MFSIRPSQTKFVFQDRILELRIGNRYFLKVEDDEEIVTIVAEKHYYIINAIHATPAMLATCAKTNNQYRKEIPRKNCYSSLDVLV